MDSHAHKCASPFQPVSLTADINAADAESVRSLFEKITQEYGRLDVRLYTAGLLCGSYVPIKTFELSLFRSVLEINVIGSFLCAKHAIPLLKQTGQFVPRLWNEQVECRCTERDARSQA